MFTPAPRDWEPVGIPEGLPALYYLLRSVRRADRYLMRPGGPG